VPASAWSRTAVPKEDLVDRPRYATVALALALALALVLPLAACSSGTVARNAATSPAATSPAATSSAGPAPSTGDDEPFYADLRPDEGGTSGGGGLSVVDVRTARQAGYDRVVLELGGTGRPGWLVRWVEHPASDGSGLPVAVAGDAYLELVVRGVGAPPDTGVPPFVGRVSATGTQQVREVVVDSVFEGQALAFVGVTGARRPFRAFGLMDPPRVVVDVRDS